jgi:hypothetical protein
LISIAPRDVCLDFHLFVIIDGIEALPIALIDQDTQNGTRFLRDSSEKGGNNALDPAGLNMPEQRSLYGIDAGKKAALNAGIVQGMPNVADFTAVVDVYIEQGSAASQDKSGFRLFLCMKLQELLQRQIGKCVSIVAKDRLILAEKILDVFQPSRRIQKNRFVAKNDGRAAPVHFGEFPKIDIRTVMGIHDESINTGAEEMVHYVSNNGTAPDFKERFWTVLR